MVAGELCKHPRINMQKSHKWEQLVISGHIDSTGGLFSHRTDQFDSLEDHRTTRTQPVRLIAMERVAERGAEVQRTKLLLIC